MSTRWAMHTCRSGEALATNFAQSVSRGAAGPTRINHRHKCEQLLNTATSHPLELWGAPGMPPVDLVAVHGLGVHGLGGPKTWVGTMGTSPGRKIARNSTAQILDLDEHRCNRRDSTPRSWSLASNGARGTESRPKPSFVRSAPAEVWATDPPLRGPVLRPPWWTLTRNSTEPPDVPDAWPRPSDAHRS